MCYFIWFLKASPSGRFYLGEDTNSGKVKWLAPGSHRLHGRVLIVSTSMLMTLCCAVPALSSCLTQESVTEGSLKCDVGEHLPFFYIFSLEMHMGKNSEWPSMLYCFAFCLKFSELINNTRSGLTGQLSLTPDHFPQDPRWFILGILRQISMKTRKNNEDWTATHYKENCYNLITEDI